MERDAIPIRVGLETAAGPSVVVLIAGYSPLRGNAPPGRTRSCGSVTLVRVGGKGGLGGRVILVDTGREDDLLLAGLAGEGVEPSQVDTVVLTHAHRDHFGCLALLPRAAVLASAREIEDARVRFAALEEEADRLLLARVTVAPQEIAGGIRTEDTPGHTLGSLSVLVGPALDTVAICGDAVIDGVSFARREPSSNAEDPELGRQSIERLARVATVIVPGHGLPFRVHGGEL